LVSRRGQSGQQTIVSDFMAYDLHIVRTEDWTDAASAPITKQDVDALIAADAELAWSTSDYVDMKDESEGSTRYYMIEWRGQSCFWWYQDEVRCAGPDEAQTVKLVEMARALKARVVGDDGEVYPVVRPAASMAPQTQKPASPTAAHWPLWKRLVAAFLFGCVLLGLKILIFGA
jgi:hypothetical protein